jgi:hypothetical protein
MGEILAILILLPHAQCALIICYRMRSVRLLFVTACAVNAYNFLIYSMLSSAADPDPGLFLGLLDPVPDPVVRDTDPAPDLTVL